MPLAAAQYVRTLTWSCGARAAPLLLAYTPWLTYDEAFLISFVVLGPICTTVRSALLSDLQVIARRIARDGSAVCDDPAHIEWLADQAWNLAWAEGQRMPSELGEQQAGREAASRGRLSTILKGR